MRKWPNLLIGVRVPKINQAAVGAITDYDDGSDLQLAQPIDVYSHWVVGPAVSDRIDTGLVMAAWRGPGEV